MIGLTLIDALALAYFLLAWSGYHFYLENSRRKGQSLHAVMDERRRDWMQSMLARDNRILDAQIMASLQNGTAFFASTSLLSIGGAITLLQAPDDLIMAFSGSGPFGNLVINDAMAKSLWKIKVIGLATIFTYAFFKFSWSYRLFNYCAILMGAVPPGRDEEALKRAQAAANMNVVAGRHFNRGQRAFFFALAYLGWFLGPAHLVVVTSFVLIVMWRRHFSSDASDAVL